MAIDTIRKRANVQGVGRPFMRTHAANAGRDEQWRVSAWNAYGGNALSPAGGRIMGSLIGQSGLIGHGGGLIQ